MLPGHDEYRVGTALSAERGTCSTEGERQLMLLAQLDNLGDFLLAVATHHDFRNLSVETGIRSPSKGTELVGINTVRRQLLSEFV